MHRVLYITGIAIAEIPIPNGGDVSRGIREIDREWTDSNGRGSIKSGIRHGFCNVNVINFCDGSDSKGIGDNQLNRIRSGGGDRVVNMRWVLYITGRTIAKTPSPIGRYISRRICEVHLQWTIPTGRRGK